MMSCMPTENLTDYSVEIRAQIEREVTALKLIMEGDGQEWDGRGWSADDVVAQYCTIGYLINLHHGQTLYAEGDLIAGLPVRIDRVNPRTIRVCADNVDFLEEIEDVDEDGALHTRESSYVRNLVQEMTW